MGSKFSKDAAGVVKGAALTSGAGVGLAAAGSMWTTAIATGTAAIASPAIMFLVLPAAGAYGAWRAASWVTDRLTED